MSNIIRLLAASLSAGVAIAVYSTAVPQAGQNPIRQVRVPTVSVPDIAVPAVPTPGLPDRLTAPRTPRLSAARLDAYVQAAQRGLNYLPGQVVVKFKPGMQPASLQRALSTMNAQPSVNDIEWHGDVAVIYDSTQSDPYVLAQQLSVQPEVEYAEPSYIATIDPMEKAGSATTTAPPVAPSASSGSGRWSSIRTFDVPSDTDFNQYQWNFNLLRMPSAWNIQPGGRSDLVVAVIDSGFTLASTTLTYQLWTGSSFQTATMPVGVNSDLPVSRIVSPSRFALQDPVGPIIDLDGHGSHVAGTIGQATNNSFLVAGMAYNVKIMPVKVCVGYWELMIGRGLVGTTGFTSTTSTCRFVDVADGIRYAADNGAKVANISLGGSGQSTAMRDALQYAVGKGMFVAISMGNDFNTGNDISYPARYAADFDGVMAVGAINKDQLRASYSSTGTHCEIAAPGGDNRSGIDGGRIWQSTMLTIDVSPANLFPRFDRYDKQGYTGTSMAAPHVSGLAALLLSQMPNLTPALLEKLIRSTARDLGTAGRDDLYGYGLIEPRIALFGQGGR